MNEMMRFLRDGRVRRTTGAGLGATVCVAAVAAVALAQSEPPTADTIKHRSALLSFDEQKATVMVVWGRNDAFAANPSDPDFGQLTISDNGTGSGGEEQATVTFTVDPTSGPGVVQGWVYVEIDIKSEGGASPPPAANVVVEVKGERIKTTGGGTKFLMEIVSDRDRAVLIEEYGTGEIDIAELAQGGETAEVKRGSHFVDSEAGGGLSTAAFLSDATANGQKVTQTLVNRVITLAESIKATR